MNAKIKKTYPKPTNVTKVSNLRILISCELLLEVTPGTYKWLR